MVSLFLDSEFTEFCGDLITLALVPEDPSLPEFYVMVDHPEPSDWVKQNVMPIVGDVQKMSRLDAGRALASYLRQFSDIEIIADWPEDLVHAMMLPIRPGKMTPMPDIKWHFRNLPDFKSEMSAIPHNALEDARALRDYVVALDAAKEG